MHWPITKVPLTRERERNSVRCSRFILPYNNKTVRQFFYGMFLYLAYFSRLISGQIHFQTKH